MRIRPTRLLLVILLVATIGAIAPEPAAASWGYLGQWGSLGSGTGQFVVPRGVTVGPGDLVYVSDDGFSDDGQGRVQRFTAAGTFQDSWSYTGSPISTLAATSGSKIYVADRFNNTIQRFASTGGAAEKTFGSSGSSDGQFAGLEGIAVAGSSVFATDEGGNRVQRFNLDGVFQAKFGTFGAGAAQFNRPAGVATDTAGNVYVVDEENARVQKLTSAGVHLLSFGGPGTANGQLQAPKAVAVAADGSVWVTDPPRNRVLKYTATGAWVGSFGQAGDGNGEFAGGSMEQIALDSAGNLYVVDNYNFRVQKFGDGGTTPPGSTGGGGGGTGDPGGAPGCSRMGHVVGVVSVCADSIVLTGTGTWRASGNVRLDGGVVIGGALDIDDTLQHITAPAGTTCGVERAGGVVDWGTGRLEIDAHAVTDPVSGRTGLATLDVYDFNRTLQTLIGGLTMNFLGSTGEYLDPADGGGLIFSVRPSFDLGAFINVQPVGSFALGVHKDASSTMRLLGGSLGWNGITLGGGWKLGLLKLEYQSAGDVWSFTGGAEFPFIASVGGIELSGSLRAGALDALGIKLKTKGIPLGQTGIVLDTFAGSLKGLSGGTGNPLIISALTAGGWTPTGAPDPFNWILHIKDVTLTINTAGSGTLSGGVAILDGEGRLAKGTISFTVAIDPFLASGALNIDIHAVALGLSFAATATMNTHHFTGTGNVSGQLVGVDVASAGGILSDAGAGATTRLCIPWWRPPWHKCWNVGYGLRWANVRSFPPDVDWIGGDLEQYRTVSASASRAGALATADVRRFTVEENRPLLYVTARASSRHTEFELIGPNGARYRLGAKRRDLYTEVREDGLVSAIVVYAPRPGTWRLRGLDLRKANVTVQEVASLGRLKAGRLSPQGSTKKPLRRSRVKRVGVSWRGQGLPRGTRVDVYVSSTKRSPGTRVAANRRATGSVRVSMRALKAKTNWVSLVARSGGIAFQRVTFRSPVRVSSATSQALAVGATAGRACADVRADLGAEGIRTGTNIRAAGLSCTSARRVVHQCVAGAVATGWRVVNDGRTLMTKDRRRITYTATGGGCGAVQTSCADSSYRGVGLFTMHVLGPNCATGRKLARSWFDTRGCGFGKTCTVARYRCRGNAASQTVTCRRSSIGFRVDWQMGE